MHIYRLSLPEELEDRLSSALSQCDEFDDVERLLALVQQGALVLYHEWFVRNQHKTKEQLIPVVIKYLYRQRPKGTPPPLLVLLLLLKKQLRADDELYHALDALHRDVEQELFRVTHGYHTHHLPAVPASPVQADLSFHTSMALPGNEAIIDRDRRWMIDLVRLAMDSRNAAGRRLLLRSCVPAHLVERLAVDDRIPPLAIAEALVDMLEERDTFNPHEPVLGTVLKTIIAEECLGETTQKTLDEVLVRYDTCLRRSRWHTPYRSSVNVASAGTPPPPYMHLDEAHIAHVYQQANHGRRTQPSAQFHIDVSSVLQCNLDTQRTRFIDGFHGHYHGFFTFTIASSNQDVLKNYVIESLVSELKRRSHRETVVRYAHLYSDHLTFADVEEGCLGLWHMLTGYFGIRSFHELLEGTQDTDLVIVLWNTVFAAESFKQVAFRFSQRLQEEVERVLGRRYFVLFWASYGSTPLQPLDIAVALPSFEHFEVEHVLEWLDTELSRAQRNQNMSDAAIAYCRERLATKIRYHGGSLPGTYESLLEPLELGGFL